MSGTKRELIDIQEAKDIAFVRAHKGIVHVSDPEALAAFTDGRGVFDVDFCGFTLQETGCFRGET